MTADRQGYLIGTLAKKLINRKLAKALMPRLPQLEMSEITFKDLPPSNYHFDANDPQFTCRQIFARRMIFTFRR